MRLGFHVSIQGGFEKAIERAEKLGCDCLQIFSRSPRSLAAKPIGAEIARRFRKRLRDSGLSPLAVHLNYLPNLASADTRFRTLSAQVLAEELERAQCLGAQFVVFHPGSHRGISERRAIRAVARAVNRALARRLPRKPVLLIENTSGQGSSLGRSFEQIAEIIKLVEDKRKVGICLDTAHAFEAGYDLSSAAGIEDMLDEIDRTMGISRLKLIHLNDSLTGLGSQADRHWHIGRGKIGKKGFEIILSHRRLGRIPAIMETPKKLPGDDTRNMKTARGLAAPPRGKA